MPDAISWIARIWAPLRHPHAEPFGWTSVFRRYRPERNSQKELGLMERDARSPSRWRRERRRAQRLVIAFTSVRPPAPRPRRWKSRAGKPLLAGASPVPLAGRNRRSRLQHLPPERARSLSAHHLRGEGDLPAVRRSVARRTSLGSARLSTLPTCRLDALAVILDQLFANAFALSHASTAHTGM